MVSYLLIGHRSNFISIVFFPSYQFPMIFQTIKWKNEWKSYEYYNVDPSLLENLSIWVNNLIINKTDYTVQNLVKIKINCIPFGWDAKFWRYSEGIHCFFI